MLEKLRLAFGIFRQGQALKAAVQVKNWTLVGNIFAALLVLIVGGAKAAGYDLPISDDAALKIGAAVGAVLLGLFNPASAIVTSDKIGLPALPGPVGPVDKSGAPELPGVATKPAAPVPYQRRAANGDILIEREPGGP